MMRPAALNVIVPHQFVGRRPALARQRVKGAIRMRLGRENSPSWTGSRSLGKGRLRTGGLQSNRQRLIAVRIVSSLGLSASISVQPDSEFFFSPSPTAAIASCSFANMAASPRTAATPCRSMSERR